MSTNAIFKKRRAEFMRRMKEGAALILSAPVAVRNNDVEHEYRQDSNFYYLTGFEEPESACLLMPHGTKEKYVLFVRSRNPKEEVWVGHRAGVEGAVKRFGADKAYSIAEFPKRLEEYLAGTKVFYFQMGTRPEADKMIIEKFNGLRAKARAGLSSPSDLRDPAAILHEMRLIKSTEEIKALRAACDASAKAHEMAMRATKPGMNEYEIDAVLKYFFRDSGSPRMGYPTIVASGLNATTLHYNENNRKMKSGDLLLIDAGTEIDYMTADITRTFPVSGKFTKEQKAVYSVVLDAQYAAIRHVKPGVTFNSVHDVAVKKLVEGLKNMGVLKGPIQKLIEKKSYARFYMHRTGHWLGMDVHDCGAYYTNEKSRKLEKGMVLTVEPGLYFRVEEKFYPSKFRGIGVRIEDDVLVTAKGSEVLSRKAPKTVAELEAIVGKGVTLKIPR